MRIEPSTNSLPIAGTFFAFDVVGEDRPVRLEATIADKQIALADCPDPPCHRMMVFLPPETASRHLTITGVTPGGEAAALTLRILPPTPGRASPMTPTPVASGGGAAGRRR